MEMDGCFVDVTVEFLAVAFHGILRHASVFPKGIFIASLKYGTVVYQCLHPEVNHYLEMCLKSIGEALKTDQLHRVEFAVTDTSHTPGLKFVFDFDRMETSEDTGDSYLVRAEQNIQAFCKQLHEVSHKFKGYDPDSSFVIYIYTNETIEVALASLPELEEFPLVEAEEEVEESDNIMPIRRFTLRNYTIDTYIEIPKPWSFCS